MARARKQRKQRRGWGSLHQLPSGRWRAAYTRPDVRRHAAPYTFDAAIDGEAWLAAERKLIVSDTWTPPKSRARQRAAAGITLATWAPLALERRRVRGEPLRPRTLALYRGILAESILPELGEHTLSQITPELVSVWYDRLDPSKPTRRAHAYSLLRTTMGQAIEDGKHTGPNPCAIRGAGKATRAREIRTATPAEIVAIAQAMPPP
ncbi:MAG: site-specific integrase, partial [Actinomycetales bacterium]|nr:site-specific integrase [Actinomycetales bacterium]